MRMHLVIISVLLVVISIPDVQAQLVREDGASVHALGMGDAVRASGTGSSSIYFNPAGIHQIRSYVIEAGYEYKSFIQGHSINASIVDSMVNEMLSAGIAYTFSYSLLDEEYKRLGHTFRAAFASGVRGKNVGVFFGVGLRYMDIDVDTKYDMSVMAADAGMLVTTNWGLRFGVVGHNLTTIKTKEAPRSMGNAIAWNYSNFTLEFDALVDFETLDKTQAQYNWGIEFYAMDRLALRSGFQLDQIRDSRNITFGFAYYSKYVGVDLGYLQQVVDEKNWILSGRIKIFLP